MNFLILAFIVSIIVGVAYISLLIRSFSVSIKLKDAKPEEMSAAEVENRGFSFKTLVAVIGAIVMLLLIGSTASVWYLVPFVSIGSAVAVCVAFIMEHKELQLTAEKNGGR